MQVILLKDIAKIGRKYQVLDVSDGYASNFLFPKGLAEMASPARIATLTKRTAASQAAEDARRADLAEKLATLKDSSVTLSVKADEQGHLYKKIHADDIVTALKDELDIELDEHSVLLPAPITTTGEHTIAIEASGKKATLIVLVVAQ